MDLSLGTEARVHIDAHALTWEFSEAVGPERRRELEEGPLRALRHWCSGGFVIHASCVTVAGRVVAFLGRSGVGKSTLALYLLEQGAALISDGMTLVTPSTRLVEGGPARLKLLEESIAALDVRDAGPYVNEARRKRFVFRSGAQQGASPRLDLAYVLVDADTELVEALPVQEQIRELLANDYLLRVLPVTEHGRALMGVASMLNAGLVVKRLHRRKAWEALETMRRKILDDLDGAPLTTCSTSVSTEKRATPAFASLPVQEVVENEPTFLE